VARAKVEGGLQEVEAKAAEGQDSKQSQEAQILSIPDNLRHNQEGVILPKNGKI